MEWDNKRVDQDLQKVCPHEVRCNLAGEKKERPHLKQFSIFTSKEWVKIYRILDQGQNIKDTAQYTHGIRYCRNLLQATQKR